MANLVRLLAVLGKINPGSLGRDLPARARRPTASPSGGSPGEEVALNPQPLPPKEALLRRLGGGRARHRVRRRRRRRPPAPASAGRLVVAGDRRLVRHRARARSRSRGPARWPFPWPPEPEPHPDWDIGASRVVGALDAGPGRLAAWRRAPARDALAKGAEQLLDAGLEA